MEGSAAEAAAAAAAAEDTAPDEGLSVSTKRTGLAGCPPHRPVAVVRWHVGSMFRGGGGGSIEP